MKAVLVRSLRSTNRHYNRFSFFTEKSTTTFTSNTSAASLSPSRCHDHHHRRRPVRPFGVLIASTVLLVLGRFSVLPITRAFRQNSVCDTTATRRRPRRAVTGGTDEDGTDRRTTHGDDGCGPREATKMASSTVSAPGTGTDGRKSTEDLQKRWAGGRDIWRHVPLLPTTTTTNEGSIPGGTVSIRNRVRRPEDEDAPGSEPWPEVVRTSVLYGFGAYDPRGQTLPDDANVRAHSALRNDVEKGLLPGGDGSRWRGKGRRVLWWEGVSVWEDGSSERGFVIACGETDGEEAGEKMTEGEREAFRREVEEWVVELATKYDQGAIYRFTYNAKIPPVGMDVGGGLVGGVDGGGRLMRETIAVLDPGTDATVEVVRDDDGINLSSLWG